MFRSCRVGLVVEYNPYKTRYQSNIIQGIMHNNWNRYFSQSYKLMGLWFWNWACCLWERIDCGMDVDCWKQRMNPISKFHSENSLCFDWGLLKPQTVYNSTDRSSQRNKICTDETLQFFTTEGFFFRELAFDGNLSQIINGLRGRTSPDMKSEHFRAY